jgi:hypothetical protein
MSFSASMKTPMICSKNLPILSLMVYSEAEVSIHTTITLVLIGWERLPPFSRKTLLHVQSDRREPDVFEMVSMKPLAVVGRGCRY